MPLGAIVIYDIFVIPLAALSLDGNTDGCFWQRRQIHYTIMIIITLPAHIISCNNTNMNLKSSIEYAMRMPAS